MHLRRFISRLSILLSLFTFSCMHPAHTMDGWDHRMGGGWFMWLIWIILIGVIVYIALAWTKRSRPTLGMTEESPEGILKKRYAKGEITREEFERLKKDIES